MRPRPGRGLRDRLPPERTVWGERGMTWIQGTRFPAEPRTSLTVRTERPVALELRLRVPSWTARGGWVALNGKRLEGFAAPGSYFVLDRTWRDRDRVDVELPMDVSACPMPDDPGLLALRYGPLVLAARMGVAGLGLDVLRAEPTRPRTVPEYKRDGLPTPTLAGPAPWVRRTGTDTLTFGTTSQGAPLELVPLHQILDERYGVYFKVSS
jgi:hypothetical protein